MISFFLSSGGERASFFIDRGTVSSLFAAIRNSFSSFFHFFIRFRFDFSSMRFFLLVDIYIQILSTILKTRQDEIKKIRLRVDSRPFLDTSWTATTSSPEAIGNHRSSAVFNDKPTDRPTDRPPDQIDFTVSGNGSVTARRYASSNKVPAIPSVGRSDFYACSACSTRVDRGRSKRRDARVTSAACVSRANLKLIYIDRHIYIYINYRPL